MGWYRRTEQDPAQCHLCCKPIAVGDKIYYLEGNTVSHAVCEWEAEEKRQAAVRKPSGTV